MKRYALTWAGTIMCLLLAVAVPEEAPVILLYITGLWMGALSTIGKKSERQTLSNRKAKNKRVRREEVVWL